MPWKLRGSVASWANCSVVVPSCPAPLPRRAPHRPDPPEVCPGFGFDRSTNLSVPKPGHTSGESGRGARRGGGAESGRTGRRQNISPRRQASLVPSKASKTRRLIVSPEARSSEILCKPVEEHSDRLTTG